MRLSQYITQHKDELLGSYTRTESENIIDDNSCGTLHLLLRYIQSSNTGSSTDGYTEVSIINAIDCNSQGVLVLVKFLTQHGTKRVNDEEWHDMEWLAKWDVAYDFRNNIRGDMLC